MRMIPVRTGLGIVVIAFALTLTSGHAFAQATEFKSSTATIGAWNLAGNFRPIDDARADAIATTVFWMDPDVLVLVEINPVSAMDTIVAKLNAMGLEYEHSTPDQSPSIDIGILYKKGVVVSGVELLDNSDLGNSGLRKALTANVQVGQFDFVAVGLHLKSSRDSASRSTRSEQAEVIAEFIEQATTGDEKDVVVVGDYNMIPYASAEAPHDLENFEAMNPDEYLRFVSEAELRGFGTHIRSNGTIGNHLDGYAVSAEHTDEYVDGSLRLFGVGHAFRRLLSWVHASVADHFPMVGTFVITKDDD